MIVLFALEFSKIPSNESMDMLFLSNWFVLPPLRQNTVQVAAHVVQSNSIAGNRRCIDSVAGVVVECCHRN